MNRDPGPQPQAPPGTDVGRGLRPETRLYLAFFLLLHLAAFLGHPIVAGDTDLWYHLDGGRYQTEHGELPAGSYFSFVEPERPWTNYYWLFQAGVHRAHRALGYPGLIGLRAALYLGALAAVVGVLLGGRQPGKGGSEAWLASAALLCALVLAPRYSLVRPHAVTYALLAASLWALETRSRLAYALPALALLWVNVHGVTYPVLLLLCLAYLADLAIGRVRRGTPLSKSEAGLAAALAGAMAAVFLTPHGTALLPVPFVSTRFAREYISELTPLAWGQVLALDFRGLLPSSQTALVLLGAAAAVGLARAIARREVRPSSLILAAGGAYLLTRSQRFGCEFALLVLPLVRQAFPAADPAGRRPALRWAGALGLAGLAAVQLVAEARAGVVRPRYPFSARNLPAGVAEFLRSEGSGGTVLNSPGTGGYLRWALSPRYRIFMDMEVPFLFTDQDMYEASYAFHDPEVLVRLVERYRPAYLSVPLVVEGFPKLVARFPDYRLVYFDDAEALYADRAAEPDLVARHEILGLDPFRLAGESLEGLRQGAGWDEAAAAETLERLVAVYPDHGLAHQLLSSLASERGDQDRAVAHAEAVIGAFPEAAAGHKLLGDALRAQGRHREALEAYRRAERRAGGVARDRICLAAGFSLRALGEYGDAYRWMRRGVGAFRAAPAGDLYELAATAVLAGELADAAAFLGFARARVPAGDEELRRRLDELAAALGLETDASRAAGDRTGAEDRQGG